MTRTLATLAFLVSLLVLGYAITELIIDLYVDLLDPVQLVITDMSDGFIKAVSFSVAVGSSSLFLFFDRISSIWQIISKWVVITLVAISTSSIYLIWIIRRIRNFAVNENLTNTIELNELIPEYVFLISSILLNLFFIFQHRKQR